MYTFDNSHFGRYSLALIQYDYELYIFLSRSYATRPMEYFPIIPQKPVNIFWLTPARLTRLSLHSGECRRYRKQAFVRDNNFPPLLGNCNLLYSSSFLFRFIL